MSSVCWLISRRKCLVCVGLLIGANVGCFLAYKQAQISSVCWIINRRESLVIVGLLTGVNVKCLLDY